MAKKKTKKLTDKEYLFVKAYVATRNATESARRAGYESPESQASDIRNRPHIKKIIRRELDKLARRYEVTAENVIGELAKLGFSNMEDYVRINAAGDPYLDLSNVDRDQMAAVTEVTTKQYKEGRGDDGETVIETKIKIADKRAALVDLGRNLELFTDKSKVQHDVASPLKAILARIDGKSRSK